ncbi:protein of unknown function [Andreprevotia lacus DSM 23236]|jgi:transglutaminase-like putative cysteine protease|uniref:Transglutaminase-like domain-containing protein n=1 Tax=Andreprevotia lacus DSM 23236 TaxID=1121001 RepID=A0A1W1XY85_9NEIS|nr:DUF3488 and transglutaminase-like domain-containing protein [Andreprevotia lacus]SMC28910.1 protein of unknown function [Andreprevotia lacus DSM 23236]
MSTLRDDLPRQPLYGSIAALFLALLPHMTQLAPWHALLILLPLGWRGLLAWQGHDLPRRWLRYGYSLLLIGVVFLQFHTLFGREGGVALLTSLLSMKLLETQHRRDARVLSLLAFFTVGAAFLVSQAFWMLAYTIGCAIAIMAQLRAWQRLDGKLDAFEYKRSAWMVLEALPIMLLLFFLFPRLSGPLWQMPDDSGSASIGLSDDMTPGSFTNLARDDSVAFRVSFNGKLPPQRDLYWRGPVLEFYDGVGWQQLGSKQDAPGDAAPELQPLGDIVRYTMTLEPHNRNWLLALDVPLPGTLPPGSHLSSRLQLLDDKAVSSRKRISLQSVLAWRTSTPAADLVNDELQLPVGGNPRARELAASWAPLSPQARVDAALAYLHNNSFVYTLDAPLLYGRNTIDDLLFSTKAGFCEHYAGAFVFLMRAAGVPARVVTGYQGGELNQDYFIVRQTDAHAWAEVWLATRGWQRVDPTAMVAPGRVTQGVARSAAGKQKLPYLVRGDSPWLSALRLRWDGAVYGWNRWVIGYDAQRQLQLLGSLGIEDFGSPRLLMWLGGCLGLFVLFYVVMHHLQSRRQRPELSQRLWLHFVAQLARHKLTQRANEGPGSFAERAARALPAHAADIQRICYLYLQARYRNRSGAELELQRRVNAFKP